MHGRGGPLDGHAGGTLEETVALNAACAASPAAASRFSANLRRMTHDEKLDDLVKCLGLNLCALLRCHLATGCSPNTHIPRLGSATALHFAVLAGSEDPARLLIDAGASLDAVGEEGKTALFDAAARGHARICSLLLARGADVKVHSLIGFTALHAAAEDGHVSAIEVLVRGGAMLDDAANNSRYTPLAVAAYYQHLDAVTKLLELGASANVCDVLGNSPFVHAVLKDYEPIARALLPHTDLRIMNCSGHNAFHSSAGQGRLSCFKLLLPHFLDDVDVRSVQARDIPGVVNPNTDKPHNWTALMLACSEGHHRIVRELLANGASRTAVGSDQCTPLMHSAARGQLACLTMLLGRPGDYKLSAAEVDARSAEGNTALHMAAYEGHRACCAVLIAAGADLNATFQGRTPLEVATVHRADDDQLIALLEGGGTAAGVPPPQLCDGCGIPSSQAPGGKLRACSACQSVAFCGTACMAQAWPGHRSECQRIKAAKEEKNCVHIIDLSKPSGQGPSALV